MLAGAQAVRSGRATGHYTTMRTRTVWMRPPRFAVVSPAARRRALTGRARCGRGQVRPRAGCQRRSVVPTPALHAVAPPLPSIGVFSNPSPAAGQNPPDPPPAAGRRPADPPPAAGRRPGRRTPPQSEKKPSRAKNEGPFQKKRISKAKKNRIFFTLEAFPKRKKSKSRFFFHFGMVFFHFGGFKMKKNHSKAKKNQVC